jgi:DNA-binding MarR family transcriptional regulator
MPNQELTQLLERLVMASVSLTTMALGNATDGLELTFPQWRVLLVLGETEDGTTVSRVAKRVGVTVPATSRQLRRLAGRGLVEVGPDDRDRRATRARLTPAGLAVHDSIVTWRRERIAELAGPLSLSSTSLHDLELIVEAFADFR